MCTGTDWTKSTKVTHQDCAELGDFMIPAGFCNEGRQLTTFLNCFSDPVSPLTCVRFGMSAGHLRHPSFRFLLQRVAEGENHLWVVLSSSDTCGFTVTGDKQWRSSGERSDWNRSNSGSPEEQKRCKAVQCSSKNSCRRSVLTVLPFLH